MHTILESLPCPNQGLIGHRGVAGLAPENTLASFIKAKSLGLNWVEFDIQQCSSGEWVVFHDETLDRTTDGVGTVEETPYELIKTLDAGHWFDPHFKNERVPLLTDVLQCLIDLEVHPNIEIKASNKDKKDLITDFLGLLETRWPKTLPPPLVSSFDLELLILLRAKTSELPLGYLVENLSQHDLNTVLKYGFNTLHCDYRRLIESEFLQAHHNKIPLLVYTVNEPSRIHSLLQAGISAVFSDLSYLS